MLVTAVSERVDGYLQLKSSVMGVCANSETADASKPEFVIPLFQVSMTLSKWCRCTQHRSWKRIVQSLVVDVRQRATMTGGFGFRGYWSEAMPVAGACTMHSESMGGTCGR